MLTMTISQPHLVLLKNCNMDSHEIHGYKPVFHNSHHGLAMYVKSNSAEYKVKVHGLEAVFQFLAMQHQSLLIRLTYNPPKEK